MLKSLAALLLAFAGTAYGTQTSILCTSQASQLGFYVTFDDAQSTGKTQVYFGGLRYDGGFAAAHGVEAAYQLINLESVVPQNRIMLTTTRKDKLSIDYRLDKASAEGFVIWASDQRTYKFADCRRIQFRSE